MLNTIGLIAAIVTFITIWLGHVMVRKLEARLLKILPAVMVCIAVGVIFIIVALLSDQNSISAVSGIIGITFLWDALEFKRQQKRVKIGHAPVNPGNPRHAQILTQSPLATTIDILDREPREKPYSQAEIESILQLAGARMEDQTE